MSISYELDHCAALANENDEEEVSGSLKFIYLFIFSWLNQTCANIVLL